MKKQIKKWTALFLVLTIVVGMCGCGKSGAEKTSVKEFYYVPSYQEFTVEADYIQKVVQVEDSLYLFGDSWDSKTEKHQNYLYCYQPVSGELKELSFSLSENASIQQIGVNPEGNFVMIVNTYEVIEKGAVTENEVNTADEENTTDTEVVAETVADTEVAAETVTDETIVVVDVSADAAIAVDGAATIETVDTMQPEEVEYRNLTELWEVSAADGSILNVIDIKPVIEDADNFWVQYMALDAKGNIYLSDGNSAIYVLDGQGNKLFSVSVNNWVDALFAAGDGNVYVKTWGEAAAEICPIDLQTRAIGEPIKSENFSGNSYNQRYYVGKESDLLISDNSNVFTYDFETDVKTDLFAWLDADINSDNVQEVGQLSDGRFWAVLCEYVEENSEYSFVILTKTPASEVAAKEEILYGTMWLDQNVRKNIIDFNKSNEQYHISVKEYGTDDYETGRTQFNNDVTGGNCPDIIDVSSIDFRMYASKGVLEDIYPYMERDGIQKTDYLENVFKAYEMDGRLYSIVPQFYITTAAAKTSKVGAVTGWTLQEMLELAKTSKPEAIFPYATRDTVFYYCVYNNIDEFINWTTGECKFNGEEFISTLEFASQFPEEWDYSNVEEEGTSAKIRSDKMLLLQTSVSSVQECQMMRGLFGEEVTYIGYPNSERKGNLIQPSNGSVAISAKSDSKDGAWEFVKRLISDEYQNDLVSGRSMGFGFPIKKSALEKQFEKDMTPEYYENENGEKVEQTKTSWGYDDFNIDIYAATQEEVDVVKEIISSAERAAGTVNEELINIVQEETAAFFKGQKSAKDTADIIQNRVQIYVNENR